MPRTVLVTGAAQGLGAAIARHLAERGDSLVLMDRDAAGLAATASQCNGAAQVVVDQSDAAATARAAAALPAIDTLIHNAAILRVEPIETVSLASFQALRRPGFRAGSLLP